MKRRIVSVLLALVMLLSLVPTVAFAENAPEQTEAPEQVEQPAQNAELLQGEAAEPTAAVLGAEPTASLTYTFQFTSSATISSSTLTYTCTAATQTNTYQVLVPDTQSAVYCWIKSPEGTATDTSFTAAWKNTSGTGKTATIAADATKGVSLAALVAKNASGNDLTLTASDDTVYTFHILRLPTIKSLTVTANDTALNIGTFSPQTNGYTAPITVAESVVVSAVPNITSGYSITYNGEASGNVLLGLGDNTIRVTVTNDTTKVSNEYTVAVKRALARTLKVTTADKDVTVLVTDAQNRRVLPTADGYAITEGTNYTVSVSKYGYVSQTQTGTMGDSGAQVSFDRLVLAQASSVDPTVTAAWKNFRNSDVNMAFTNAATPKSAASTQLKWAQKMGSGWGNAPSVQIIADNALIVMLGTSIYKLSLTDGSTLATGTMAASPSYGYTPPTYAEGMIFCPLGGGKVQAFDAKTLTSLWVYTDALGGQAQSPITYSNGYLYTGFWNGETADANYVCLSVTDEDPTQTNEAKTPVWTSTQSGGFYWAGSAVVGNAVIVGTDDGTSGYDGNSHLYSLNKNTGEVINDVTLTGMGDQRSSIAYSPEKGRVYFTTKNGYLCSVSLNSSTGELSDLKSNKVGPQSTSTPVVYGNYVFYCAGSGVVEGSNGAGHFVVANADTLAVVSSQAMLAYPQCSPLVSTAYLSGEGKLYCYCTYNGNPGGISLIKVDASTGASELEELYDAAGYEQYCITSLICDESGTIYYKNDSGSVLAVSTNSAWAENIKLNNIAVADFAANKVNYANVFDRGTEKVKVTVTPCEGGAVTINGESAAEKDITLTADSAANPVTVSICVTKGGDTRTYTLSLRWKNNDASLAKLDVNESNTSGSGLKTLSPVFDGTAGNYAFLGATETRKFENVWPKSADSNATVKVYAVSNVDERAAGEEIPATSGSRYAIYFGSDTAKPTVIRVVVTAEDGVTQKEYHLYLAKSGSVTPAAEGEAYITLSVAGDLKLAQRAVTLTDLNGDGIFDVDEALRAAHKAFAPNNEADYASAYTGYGLSLTKLWGDNSGNFGYWLNDVSCLSLADEVKAGDHLAAFVYADSVYWSDAYAKFTDAAATATTGVAKILSLQQAGYDADWNTVWNTSTDAVLKVYDSNTDMTAASAYATVSGNTVTFTKSGTYYVTAEKADKSIVPAVCKVEVADCSHSYDSGKVTKAATCIADGEMTYTCTVCQATKAEPIAALGHNWADATCTAPKTCRRCSLTEGTALAHTYNASGVCSVCGSKNPIANVKVDEITADDNGTFSDDSGLVIASSNGATLEKIKDALTNGSTAIANDTPTTVIPADSNGTAELEALTSSNDLTEEQKQEVSELIDAFAEIQEDSDKDNAKVELVLDLSMELKDADGNPIAELTELPEPVTVRVPISDEEYAALQGKSIVILRSHTDANGETVVTELNAVLGGTEGNYYVEFASDRFSTFALVSYEPAEEDDPVKPWKPGTPDQGTNTAVKSGNTGDTGVVLYIALGTMSGIGSTVLVRKRREEE